MSVFPTCMSVHQIHASVRPSGARVTNVYESLCGWVLGINPGPPNPLLSLQTPDFIS